MGGNRKQANRTKNNARPANSGRSAELLGNTPPPFVGFSAVKDGAFVTVLPGFSSNVEDINPDVDPNFQILLKKMNKKDSTTKLKALQEFSELIKGSDIEAVKAILPFWPRLYCQLATDVEHRVREALHQAQRVVVSKAKRNIAPFLKQLAGPWFTSQYDTYAPAATAAQLAFQEAFPPNKLLEAINFCQEEILAYIADNLTVQTPQTLSNPKTTAPDDMEAKHQRVLTSSLQGYVLYLRKLPSEQLLTALDSNQRLVGNPKYWKLAKHAAPMVRGAWFAAVIALCQESPDLVTSEAPRVVTSTLGRLDETDPAVLPLVWEAALHVVTTLPDCWSHVNADKVVLPKLYALVREGGQGNAASIFPNLLPFLSKLPAGVTGEDKQAFYDRFFDSMRTGFTQKCVVQSSSESAAVAKCYVECLQYAIVTNQKDPEFCRHVIQNQMIPGLGLALTDPRLNLFYPTHFAQLSLLVHGWERNRSVEPNARLLDAFWSGAEELNARCLRPPPPPNHTPERQVALCLRLKSPAVRGRRAVKFTGGGDPSPSPTPAPAPATPDHGDDFSASLFRLARSLCSIYLRLSETHGADRFLPPLSSLVAAFDSRRLFEGLAAGSLIGLFEHPLRGWLETGVEPAIDVALVLLKHLEPAERLRVLDVVGQTCAGPRGVECLTAALAHREDDDGGVAGFLQSEPVCRVLTSLARGVCAGTAGPRDWDLLRRFCVGHTGRGDWIVRDETLCELVSVFSDALSNYVPTAPLASASLADLLFSRRLSPATIPQAQTFLVRLLHASTRVPSLGTAVQGAVRLLGMAGGLEGVEDSVAELVWTELSSGAFPRPLAAAVYRFLSAVSPPDDTPPVGAVHRFLAKCSAHLVRLRPALHYLALDGYGRQRVHSPLASSGSCLCRRFREPTDPSFSECFDVHLLCHWFHLLLIERLTLRDRGDPDNEDEDEEDKDQPSEDSDEPSTLCEALEPLKHHVGMLSDSIEICVAFAARYPSTVYNYKIFTRFATLSRICKRLGKFEALRFDTRIFHPRENTRNVGLRLPWNRTVPRPEVSEPTTCEESCADVEQPAESSPHPSEVSTDALVSCWTELSGDLADPLDAFDALLTLDRKLFLFETDVSAESEVRVVAVATTAQFMADLIDARAREMTPAHWDLVVIALASWAQSVKKSAHTLLVASEWLPVRPRAQPTEPIEPIVSTGRTDRTDPHDHNAAVLTEAVARLFVSFRRHLGARVSADPETSAAHDKMRREWADLFECDTDEVMVDVFLVAAECCRGTTLSLLDLPAIEAVALALQSIDVAKCSKRDELLECCLRTTCSPISVLQLAAFHVLHDLAFSLALRDSETLLASEDLADAPAQQLTLRLLLPQLAFTRTVVTAMLADVRPGESCIVPPYTDASTYTLAYLMIWTVVLSMCRHADSVLRSQYAAIVREENNLDHLLRAVFRLMPEEVLAISHGKSRARRTQDLFSVPPKLERDEMVTSIVVEQLACWVYWLCLCRLPAEVRMWWSSVDQRYCTLADRVSTNHVSPVLCDLEMKTVQTHVAKRKSNITIKVHASVNEVHAVYTVDEARLELSMSLPANYPLGLVVIDTKNTEKIQESGKEGRGWLMQLRMFLSHQNGSLWEGLSLWKSNLDKRFEGVEECYICYSILHGSNFQLPKVACRTCKKKFHSGCMYKWFNTSNKPTCPICRNQF